MAHTTYRGYDIYRTAAGNYWSDAFGPGDVAASIATMHRWIDAAIASGEIR